MSNDFKRKQTWVLKNNANTALSCTHTERQLKRQRQRQIGYNWNTLWRLEIDPPPFPSVTMYSNETQSAVDADARVWVYP